MSKTKTEFGVEKNKIGHSRWFLPNIEQEIAMSSMHWQYGARCKYTGFVEWTTTLVALYRGTTI